MKLKCPRCGCNTHLSTERRPDGDSRCLKCDYSGKTTLFLQKMNTVIVESNDPPSEEEERQWQDLEIKHNLRNEMD